MKYEDLIALKKSICSCYLTYYKKKGFESIAAMPLDNKKDITLDFTTCTICTAKNNIRNNKKGQDYVMIQPALRNTHMEVLSKVDSNNYFFSFFSMMGGFKYYSNSISYKDEFSDIIKNEFIFLKKYCSKIVLTIPIQYEDKLCISNEVVEFLKTNNCCIKYSNDDANNLKWKYGIRNVEGYGTRWEISNGGDLVNWGNTINVFVNNVPFGVDFGGGVESLIYANLRLKNSIYANDSMTDNAISFCQDDSIKEKMLDCIVSSMCIISNKKDIILRNKYILETYMNLLLSYMTIANINKKIILELVDDINKKQIPFLHHKNMANIFEQYLDCSINKHNIILNANSIDMVLTLFDLCYNSNENWQDSKKIVKSHFSKYFSNLSEVELLALQKSRNKRLERKKLD